MIQSDTFIDLLIFGTQMEDILEPFRVGDLAIYPNYDVRKALGEFDQNTILIAVKSGAVFSKYRQSMDSKVVFPSLDIEDAGLLPFRLFKGGWISAVRIGPELKNKVERIYHGFNQPTKQVFIAQTRYLIKKDELPKIGAIHKKLTCVPEGYLEFALKLFSRSYDFWINGQLINCIVDLADAFESIASRKGDGNLRTLCLRTALLLGDNLYDRVQIQEEVKKFYDVKSRAANMRATSDNDFYQHFLIVEDSQSLVRAIIRASVDILGIPQQERLSGLPDTMEMVIDEYLFEVLSRNQRL